MARWKEWVGGRSFLGLRWPWPNVGTQTKDQNPGDNQVEARRLLSIISRKGLRDSYQPRWVELDAMKAGPPPPPINFQRVAHRKAGII